MTAAKKTGLALTGPGGLLGRLAKVVLEGALEGELDAHLGYAKHDPAGRHQVMEVWPLRRCNTLSNRLSDDVGGSVTAA